MARQFFNEEDYLKNKGDYAWFNLVEKTSGEIVHRFFALNYGDSNFWSFFSEGCIFNGNRMGIDDAKGLTGIEINSAWVVVDDKDIAYGIRDCMTSECFPNNCRIEIVTDEIPLLISMLNDSEVVGVLQAGNFEIVKDYEVEEIYAGIKDYHYHHGLNLNKPIGSWRGHRIGIELEVEFDNSDDRNDFAEIESNWFYRERDGSLNSYGCEIITIPLLPKHAKSVSFWTPLTSYLGDKAKSWDTGRCGLHIHIGREILGRDEEAQSETIGKLLYLYHHYVKDTRLNIYIFGRERGYHDQDGKTDIGNAAKLLGPSVLTSKEIQDRVKNSMITKSNRDRYFDINLRNSKTIEFRKGKGSINPKRIAMVVEYCEILCKYAKSTPWRQITYEDFVSYLKITAKNDCLKDILRRY